MKELYIVAEAAQGYEGSEAQAMLLTRAAAAGKAQAVKFQIVYADDLCTSDYEHAALFRTLELPRESWHAVREHARSLGLEFIVDVFGPASLEVALAIDVDGIKLHSTTFFDDALTHAVLASKRHRTFVSVGGIEPDEITDYVARHALRGRSDVVVMFGYQAEPTPIERNNLARIATLREALGLDVGFMDHSDGDGPDTLTLSAMALAMGVTVFEKHVSLDRALELEDYISALSPTRFAEYTSGLVRLQSAIGAPTLEITSEERSYRARALKRVIAARDLKAGTVLKSDDLAMLRPGRPGGIFSPVLALGRRLAHDIPRHQPIDTDSLAKHPEV